MAPDPKTISTVEKIFWDNWFSVLITVGLILLLLLVGGIVYYLIKRKKAQAEEIPAEPAKEVIKPSALRQIWKSFLKEIPGDLRRRIMVFDQFVVFGGAGAGKTLLIDNYTDWQGYSREFYPSYTTNPLLQIYLGSKVMVQEIPASLVGDTTGDVRKSLLKLWKPIFKHRAPTVVVALNGAAFEDEENLTEHLSREAQYIRGKINLLSWTGKRPVKVRIALTHMDLIEGYSAFSEFLARKNIPFQLHFSSNEELNDLTKEAELLEEHLTEALITLPADKYLQAVSFIRRLPKIFENLKLFLEKLTRQDPLSVEPQITDVYLTSQEEKQVQLNNPFAAQITKEEMEKYDPYVWHRRAALASGLVITAFLIASFALQLASMKNRRNQVDQLVASFSPGYEKRAHQLFTDNYFQDRLLLKFTPCFFKKQHQGINRDLIESIRRYYFYSRLDNYSSQTQNTDIIGNLKVQMSDPGKHYAEIREGSQEKFMLIVGLLYATGKNELGKMIKGNVRQVSSVLLIPETLINDYVENNQSEWPVKYDLKDIKLIGQENYIDELRKMIDIHGESYFTRLTGLYKQQTVSEVELENILRETDHFLMIIKQYEIHNFYIKIADLLKKEINLMFDIDARPTTQPPLEGDDIGQFLAFIQASSIKPLQTSGSLRFDNFKENIKIMLNYGKLNADRKFTFSCNNKEFTFSSQQWNDLLSRSRVSVFIQRFIALYKIRNGFLFFSAEKEFEDIVMNSTNDGGFLFVGKAVVDGRFTKTALEKRVKPCVTELPLLVNTLPVPESDKIKFLDFFRREVEFYGQKYADSYRSFYLHFDMRLDSSGALRFALNQMFQPSSTFMTFLQTIKDNTQIDAGDNEYMKLISGKMTDFVFIKRLIDDKNSPTAELDKYRILLDQMKTDLQQEICGIPKKNDKDDSFAPLKSQLTPLGQVAFAINKQDKDSYLNLAMQWLDSVGITKKWRDLFLAPVWTAYFLGMHEVEQKIAQSWNEIREENISPLYHKFPFNPTSADDADVDDITNATHPQGRFWQAFQKTIAPYCKEAGGKWKSNPGSYGLPKLPPKMLATLNTVSSLTNIFWDKEGNARPLEFRVKPNPLPKVMPDEPVPVLSYVTVGQSSLMSFNQQLSWASLKIKWQNSCPASVGVELMPRRGTVKYKSSIEIANSNWCFHKLLKKTEEYGDMEKNTDSGNKKSGGGLKNDVRWVIDPTSDKIKSHPIEIKLTFKQDPWGAIILPRN